MPNGIIKFFNAAKGFGFVTPDEGGKDVYVPAQSVTSAGLATLKAGQPISFDVEPDGKGAKAVGLKLISRPQPQKPQRELPPKVPELQADTQLTFYHDPSWEEAEGILAELRGAGQEPRIVDYAATPPTRDELKRLSMLLRSGGQSLVRRYDPLFLALNLDDRFISENDYWDAIVEHPTLINGPLVAVGARAGICQSRAAMKAFLSADTSRDSGGAPEKKGISDRLLRLMGGASPASLPEREKPVPSVEVVPVKKSEDEPKPILPKKVSVKPRPEPKPEPKLEPKPEPKKPAKPKAAAKPKLAKVVKAKPKTKAAPAPKPKKAVKAAPRKPARKAARSR